MSKVIDFHVQLFPNQIANRLDKISPTLLAAVDGVLPIDRILSLRKQARTWMKPLSSAAHHIQTVLRHLPEMARNRLDELNGVLPLPGLLLESSEEDLKEAMDEAGVDQALLVAQPPFLENNFVLELSQRNQRLIPVVNIPKGTHRPGQLLRQMVEKGAKALKLHPAWDGEGVDSARYRALIKAATDLNIPVIIHTGHLHSRLLYKKPDLGNAERFTSWYAHFPSTQFVLAHMNLHNPNLALDICEEFENVWVETSWQPAEVIGEAVRRMGPDRVLFGSDWPYVGNNMQIGIERIHEGVKIGMLNQEQARLILGGNARRLLGLQPG
jgi:predicted TIM-barrel fold metal-dependent hydrolase